MHQIVRRGLILLVALVFTTTGCGGPKVNAAMKCRDFLSLSSEKRDAAVKKVGTDLGIRTAGSPLTLPDVEYRCGESPGLALGEVLKKEQY